MKKFISFLLTIIMVFSMAVSVFATSDTNDNTNNTGTIIIDNAVDGQIYDIYRILELESFDESKNAYAYKVTEKWKSWLKDQSTYVIVDEQGYVTWKTGADPAAFAKAALAAAKANSIGNDGSKVAAKTEDGETTVTFENLPLGYYLVDTSLGTFCSLGTTAESVTIKEKNEVPSVDKKVKEDSETDPEKEYGSSNTAQIGDTIEFKTTIHAKKGAQNYVLHDKMTEGLTLNKTSISIEGLKINQDYTVEFNKTHTKKDAEGKDVPDYTCAFEITFSQAYLDKIDGNRDLVVTYSAILNGKAAISTDANLNDTRLQYGEASSTEWSQTKTYTFKFDLVKTDKDDKLLTGAKFELYDAKTGGNKIALVKEAAGVYRIATDAEQTPGFVSAVIEAGKVEIKGLDADTSYYLEETKAPDGFNKLKERVEVKMEKENITVTMDGNLYKKGGIRIINNNGTELPSTGGMGTTVLYIAGALLILAAAAVLLLRRHFRKEA